MSDLGARLDAYERALVRIGAADAGRATGARVEAREAPPPAPRDRASIFSERDDQLAEFDREPLDPAWAPEMTREIDDGLAELEKSGTVHFTSSVECRSTRCVARLTWPDFKTARAEYMAADVPSSSCARSLTLDEPRDEAVPIEAKIIHRCKKK